MFYYLHNYCVHVSECLKQSVAQLNTQDMHVQHNVIKNPTFFEQSSALLVFSFWNFFTSVAFGKSTQQLKGAPVFFVIKWRVCLGHALFSLILSITSKRHFKTRRAIHSCVPERYYIWWIVIVATWKWEHWKWTNKKFHYWYTCCLFSSLTSFCSSSTSLPS